MAAPRILEPVRRFGALELDLARRIAVMAIVNRTPDSFYDRGRTFEREAAIEAGKRAFEQGADIVDVGGVKFAPGPRVTIDDELDRVLPVVRELSRIGPVSVDTFRPEVAAEAIAAGASLIN